MADFALEPLDEDENNPPEPDEFDVCHHGVGFDEECEDCELEIEAEGFLDGDFADDDEYDGEIDTRMEGSSNGRS